jgi:citrate lyase subunit beta/citryl-CoA lyase
VHELQNATHEDTRGPGPLHGIKVLDVSTVYAREFAWAREVLAAFDAAGGAALRLADGEFVDLPVAQRARRVLQPAEAVPREPVGV